MPAINDRFDLLKACPSLSDSKILARNPGILDVVWFVYAVSFLPGGIPLFEDLGIKNLDEYVRLVDSRTNFRARRSYEIIRENLPWNSKRKTGSQ